MESDGPDTSLPGNMAIPLRFPGWFRAFRMGIRRYGYFTVFVFYYQERRQKFPSWLVRLGDMSFSIYLLHVPIVVGVGFLFRRLGFPVFSEGPAMFLLSLALTLIGARLSHEFLELKLTSHLTKRLIPAKKLTLKQHARS